MNGRGQPMNGRRRGERGDKYWERTWGAQGEMPPPRKRANMYANVASMLNYASYNSMEHISRAFTPLYLASCLPEQSASGLSLVEQAADLIHGILKDLSTFTHEHLEELMLVDGKPSTVPKSDSDVAAINTAMIEATSKLRAIKASISEILNAKPGTYGTYMDTLSLD